MGFSTRIRSASLGYSGCTCEGCVGRGGKGKGFVKRRTARKVRRSERQEIESEE